MMPWSGRAQLAYSVSLKEILKAGKPLCVLESMKGEMQISVPEKSLNGVCKAKELQIDLLSPCKVLWWS